MYVVCHKYEQCDTQKILKRVVGVGMVRDV